MIFDPQMKYDHSNDKDDNHNVRRYRTMNEIEDWGSENQNNNNQLTEMKGMGEYQVTSTKRKVTNQAQLSKVFLCYLLFRLTELYISQYGDTINSILEDIAEDYNWIIQCYKSSKIVMFMSTALNAEIMCPLLYLKFKH